ncbi:MAG: DNA gyrase subunit B, partial [Thermoguttaceae bacterium]|nr:DNA gyrase subunit B [Thermoguttaceae bacterium]
MTESESLTPRDPELDPNASRAAEPETTSLDDGYQDASKANADYTSADIESLSDLEHVRLRPSMYIGDVATSGLHHLVNEVVDNSLDEALAGFATEISVTVERNGAVTVRDDGRGIPVDIHPDLGVSTLEGVMTRLKFGGKFSKGAYQTSGGLHGVGVTVVNFLSEWCNVEVCRDGFQYFQEYRRGEPKAPVTKGLKSDKHGTKTTFKPDPEIFPDTKFQYGILYGRLRDLAFLNPNIKINFLDERDGRGETFHCKNGVADFVTYLNKSYQPIHNDVICVHGGRDGVTVDIALQYTDNDSETIRTYVNNVHTHEGGTHVAGFRTALTKVLNAYGVKENLFGKTIPDGEDFREGLTVVISARVPEPKFEGQTKTKLGNTEVAGIVQGVFANAMTKYLEEHPNNAKVIVKRAVLAQEAREAAKRARQLVKERKNVLNGGGMPGKLRDCTSRDVDRCELYLVEGNSAGGSAEGGRIREFQAILPLRGKVINAYKAQDARVLKNEEVRSMIVAFGAGFGDEMDLTKRRYGKIVIMTDADVDGSHIRTLLLTFFYRQMYAMVKSGFVYVAQPPLFRVRKKGKNNSKARYVQTEEEMKRELLESGVQAAEFDPRDGRILDPEQTAALCRLLNQMEESIQALEKRGFGLRQLANLQDPVTANLPIFRLIWRKQEEWFFDRSSLNERLRAIEEETGKPIDELTGSISGALDQSNAKIFNEGDDLDERLRVDELDELRSLNDRLVALREKFGFEFDSLFPIQRTGVEGARYAILRGEGDKKIETGVEDLRAMLAAMREAGEKGFQITRFKGLGEMDPEELRETTLDPENRTLVQV